MNAKLTASQARVLALVTEHGTIVKKWNGAVVGGIKGFNITAAASLAKKGLVRFENDDMAKLHIITLETRVVDVDEAHTLALAENAHRTIAQTLPEPVAEAAETNPEYAPAAFLPTEPGCPFLGDFSDAPCTLAEGHAGDHLVRYSSGYTARVINVEDDSADPIVESTASVPPGGFPSPYAVALLARMAQSRTGTASTISSCGLSELAERGLSVKVPGLELHAITAAGREFARRWILAPTAS